MFIVNSFTSFHHTRPREAVRTEAVSSGKVRAVSLPYPAGHGGWRGRRVVDILLSVGRLCWSTGLWTLHRFRGRSRAGNGTGGHSSFCSTGSRRGQGEKQVGTSFRALVSEAPAADSEQELRSQAHFDL